MGETKLTFKRYEKKYLLPAETYEELFRQLAVYIVPDEYPHSSVCSLYYDCDDYLLIRRSLEGPVYKEKLRLRSYKVPRPEDPVFVELKKKYKGIVYKRRISMGAAAAADWLAGRGAPPEDSQMAREIAWFLESYHPRPRAFIACDRWAWRAKDDPELRITFDKYLRWRDWDLDLCAGDQGEPLLPAGSVLMEIKIPGAAPLWLVHILSRLQVYPRSFSKYGTCYKDKLLEKIFNEYDGVNIHV